MKNLYSKSLSKKKVTIAFASLLVFALLLGFDQGSKKTVALTLNGKQKIVKTNADTISSLLAQQNVTLNSKDYIFPDVRTPVQDNMKIIWKKARQVHIVKDNEKKTVWTTAFTVAGLLKEQKIVLTEHDKISPNPGRPIKAKMNVNIKLGHRLTLTDRGIQQEVWSTSTTVADFLKQQGVKLNELDRVEPSVKETVKENDRINIIRVEKVTDVVEEPIKFAVVTRQDANLEKGKSVTITEGVPGIASKKYEITLENGKEVARNLISEIKIKEKKDKVVAVGTKVLAFQVSRGQISGRAFYVRATAYTADCNGCSGRTATGLNLYANPNAKVIAVDPSIIPLGSKVYVDGYGYAIAADTGGAIHGYSIDVFFSSKAEAYQWGARKVKITVLN